MRASAEIQTCPSNESGCCLCGDSSVVRKRPCPRPKLPLDQDCWPSGPRDNKHRVIASSNWRSIGRPPDLAMAATPLMVFRRERPENQDALSLRKGEVAVRRGTGMRGLLTHWGTP